MLCLVLAGTAPFTTDESHATLRGVGSALYVVGVFFETMVVNVPMNNALDAVDPAGDEGRVDLAHVPASVDSVEPRAGASGHRSIGDAGRVAPVTPQCVAVRSMRVPNPSGDIRGRRPDSDHSISS